jgi:hypothetical protein
MPLAWAAQVAAQVEPAVSAKAMARTPLGGTLARAAVTMEATRAREAPVALGARVALGVLKGTQAQLATLGLPETPVVVEREQLAQPVVRQALRLQAQLAR